MAGPRSPAPWAEPGRRAVEQHPFKRTIESAARARLAMPVVVLVALVTMGVNESTYQHASRTLRNGIVLSDARTEAARTLQGLTDLEAAARAYLVSGDVEDKNRYEAAAAGLPTLQAGALARMSQVDATAATDLDGLRDALAAHKAQMSHWMELAGSGQRARALGQAASEAGRAQLLQLRSEFDRVLLRATLAQQTTRMSLIDTMQISRGAVHVLVLLAVLALGLFVRQLRRFDNERAQQQERLEQQIDQRTAELRELAGHLVSAREDERSRVARELHDEMGGLLTAMKLEFARLRRVPGLPPAALERTESIEARLNEGIKLKRRIVENLRPSSLDQLGLGIALQMLCDDMAQASGLHIDTRLDEVVLVKDAELSLFRLVQESLTNIVKYAGAQHVRVQLRASAEGAELVVEDDGCGFDPAAVRPGHHGLLGMRVRVESHAGNLALHSAPGQGTRIVAWLPRPQGDVLAPSGAFAEATPNKMALGEEGFDKGLATGGASGI